MVTTGSGVGDGVGVWIEGFALAFLEDNEPRIRMSVKIFFK